MKKKLSIVLFSIGLLTTSCLNDDIPTSAYEAKLMNRSAFEKSTTLSESRTITNSGKIYIKDNFLFVNEVNEGFHIFDNRDPQKPKNIMFLNVLGATDIAIKNDVLFINNSTDLIAITINQETKELTIQDRIKNAFPQKISPDGFDNNTPQDQIIIDWIKK